MRTRILNVVLLAALVFAVTRLWRFVGEPPPALPSIIAAAPATVAPKRETKPVETVPRPESYDVIVARDLFSATRGIVPPAPTTAARPAPKPQPPPKLTLAGVVIIDGEKTAFLQEGAVESRPRKVREKETFAGGVVSSIRPDGITFVFAGSEITIPLRTPKDGAAGGGSAGGRDPGSAAPRAETPVVFPRRPAPPNIQPGQMPLPGRPIAPPTRGPSATMPGEPGTEDPGDEEFPEGMGPGGEPSMPPDEEVVE